MTPPELAELERITTELAELHREEAVAWAGWRRQYLATITDLMSNQGKSATEAKVWAEAASLQHAEKHVTLRAEITALTERRDYLRIVVGS